MQGIDKSCYGGRPIALLWAESSGGSGHLQVISQLARGLIQRCFRVIVVTSSMTVGSQFDYGDAEIFELPRIDGNRKGDHGFTTAKGSFRVESRSAVLCYLTDLEAVCSQQRDTAQPDLSKPLYPWGETLEAFPLGAWRVEIRRYIAERQKLLRELFCSVQPDVVVTEFWPIGRTNSDVELVPLMEFMRNSDDPPLIFSLERDVLLNRPPLTDNRVSNTNKYIDGVIVRGDDGFIGLPETFPEAAHIKQTIFYAGYFATPLPARREIPEEDREVLVSAGGGFHERAMGLYLAAIAASKLTILKDHTWRLLVSPKCTDDVFEELQKIASRSEGNIVVERNRSSSEYKQLLADSALSITQGGYNATVEVASGNAPAIIVPIENPDLQNNEQPYRANRFQELGLLTVVPQNDADDPDEFARCINAALKQAGGKGMLTKSLRINGASRAAEYIAYAVEKRMASDEEAAFCEAASKQ